MLDAADLIARDRASLWHPYASTTTPGPLYAVRDARGTRLTVADDAGEYDVVDGMASWWCAIHGYRHPQLDAALHAQAERFSHVMFGGLTHDPAVRLAERLVEMTPEGLDRVFLADSGSVAMEVALKLARQVGMSRGPRTRTKVAALLGGYHGDTLGAMSVCDPDGGMHSAFADAIPRQVFLPRPPAFDATPEAVTSWAAEAREVLHAHRDVLCAIACEPILQGAGGMHPWAPAALQALRELADEYDLLLIADEIATGFGRTGELFACNHADVTPDVLVVGKALTGGYMTQAALIVRETIANEIGQGPFGVLMHGPTFMANPLASAVSLASLDILGTGEWETQVAHIETRLRERLLPLEGRPGVNAVRVLGATGCVEATEPVDMHLATRTALEHGVWLRPFGRLVYVMPPYISSEDDLEAMTTGIAAVIEACR